MLKITNLKSGYNKMQVLKGIDFVVKQKEIVAIIGPNGAGKSTLLKSIFNLCEIYSGKIEFFVKVATPTSKPGSSLNKKDFTSLPADKLTAYPLTAYQLTRLPTHKLIGLGISYVPQGRQVFNDLTVRENLEMGGFIFKNKKIIEKNVANIFNRFPFLEEKQNDYAFTLSGGQQQVLAIARALMQNPKLLLLDEPSLGLSPKMMKDIFKIIKEINSTGVTIIIVEQNAKQAVEIADKTYVLENGKVALTGDKTILENKKIKNVYFGGM